MDYLVRWCGRATAASTAAPAKEGPTPRQQRRDHAGEQIARGRAEYREPAPGGHSPAVRGRGTEDGVQQDQARGEGKPTPMTVRQASAKEQSPGEGEWRRGQRPWRSFLPPDIGLIGSLFGHTEGNPVDSVGVSQSSRARACSAASRTRAGSFDALPTIRTPCSNTSSMRASARGSRPPGSSP